MKSFKDEIINTILTIAAGFKPACFLLLGVLIMGLIIAIIFCIMCLFFWFSVYLLGPFGPMIMLPIIVFIGLCHSLGKDFRTK